MVCVFLSPDDGLSGVKHIVSEIIKTFGCVTVTFPFSFLSTTSRMQHYEMVTDAQIVHKV
jgi:hypothetical protein